MGECVRCLVVLCGVCIWGRLVCLLSHWKVSGERNERKELLRKRKGGRLMSASSDSNQGTLDSPFQTISGDAIICIFISLSHANTLTSTHI